MDSIIEAAGLDRATDDTWREVKATYYGSKQLLNSILISSREMYQLNM